MCDNAGSESQDTASSSMIEDSISLSFEDVEYTVRRGLVARGSKRILSGVSGSCIAGELTVLIGQSGAGKSSLMDILAGYKKPTSGRLCVNGRLRDERWFRRRSCYIMQDDRLQEMLTVHESLMVAASLKLGTHVSEELKTKRVEEIITALGLSRSRKTRAVNLSGGQKKRLAIGLELVSDPPVMFLDEPTSGLDSSISKQMVYLLQLLARQGRCVVATIHQPSAALLHMVDKLYAVSAGRCAFLGSVSMLVPYMDALNLKCPPFHNPVDFFIEICADNTELLVAASQNGRSKQWVTDIPFDTTEDSLFVKYNLNFYEEISLTALPAPKTDETSKILLRLKSTYATSTWKQFTTLTKRALLSIKRDPTSILMITGIHVFIALLIGCLFFNIGGDAKFMEENHSYLFFSLMFLMFTSFSVTSINFPQELPVVRREHFNRWYSVGAYYLATLISALPTQTVCAITYASITYYMTGQPPNALRFFGFSLILVIVCYVSLCLGLLNGSLLSTKNAVIFGPFFIMPFTIFSGFFLRFEDAPVYSQWVFHVSFLKHGLVGLLLSIFGMERPKLPCSKLYCHYTYPRLFLSNHGCNKELYSRAILALIGIGISTTVCSFLLLKLRLKKRW